MAVLKTPVITITGNAKGIYAFIDDLKKQADKNLHFEGPGIESQSTIELFRDNNYFSLKAKIEYK